MTNSNPPSTNTPNTPNTTTDPAALDNALRAALSGADRPDTIASLLADSLRGQSRPLSILMLFVQLAMFALAVASVVWFFDAASTKWQIFYAVLFLWLMSAMGMIKAWFWMQIHRNRVLREVKRLELQVARLADASTPAA